MAIVPGPADSAMAVLSDTVDAPHLLALLRGFAHDYNMSKSRDVLVAAAMTLAIASGYVFATRPRSSHAAVLRDLYASPLCLRTDGNPRPDSPTIEQAWLRTVKVPIAQATPDFIGMSTIELHFTAAGAARSLSFIVAGSHRWRFNDDVTTAAWMADVCGPMGGPEHQAGTRA
jgi:hypothetical protein